MSVETLPDPGTENPTETIGFGRLQIRFDHRVLRPRPWTQEQSRWASTVLDTLGPGPVLELCAGAGHIGLLAIADRLRQLVSVDVAPAAGELTALNASCAGLADHVDVRRGTAQQVLGAAERFALVIADPPWVCHARVADYPLDPTLAIDGGVDGLAVARECVEAAEKHLLPGGVCLLQIGSLAQVDQLAAELAAKDLLRITEIRHFPEQGVLIRLDQTPRKEETR